MKKVDIRASDIDCIIYDTRDGNFMIQLKEEFDSENYKVPYSEGLHIIFTLDRIRDASKETLKLSVIEDEDEDETVEEVDEEEEECSKCVCKNCK